MSRKSGLPGYPYFKLRSKNAGGVRRSTLGTRPPLPGICDASPAVSDDVDPRLGVGLYDPAKPAPAPLVSASAGADRGPSVKNAKSPETLSDDAQRKDARRLDALALKDAAAKLLYHSGDEKLVASGKRVSQCCLVPHGQSPVALNKTAKGAYMSGLKRCSSAWLCSICSARISAGRRDELNLILEGARQQGLSPVMLALTARHSFRDALPDTLAAMKFAKDRVTQLQSWRDMRAVLAGSVTATEVTYGDNGWHVHYHVLLLLRLSPADALAMAEGQRAAWLTALSAAGLSGNDHAFRVDPATNAGDYFGKYGAACELALARSKQGRVSGSRNPWDLLAEAAQGDLSAGRLWLQYAKAFRGRRQLVFSKGLRAMFGLDDVADDALPDAAADAEGETVVLREWTCVDGWERWRSARRRLASLLTAAETGGSLDAAEFGPTDKTRWQRFLAESAVLE